LKEGIGLRGYGQKDPLVEYKKESFVLFQDMMDRIEDETVRYLFFLQAVEREALRAAPEGEDWQPEDEPVAIAAQKKAAAQGSLQDFTRTIQRKKEKEMAELQFVGGDSSNGGKQVIRSQKVGRNEPCPCGSGKKYKKCHGA
jgi:preprotein translocase subunit SecA